MEREAYLKAARERAFLLYEGVQTPHRSCGIALAETFGLPTLSYQALRRGGITGEGSCGAVMAGVLVLGELLGDPDPTGMPTAELRRAIPMYREKIKEKLDLQVDSSCNARVAAQGDFGGTVRKRYCTELASLVAETVAEVLWELGKVREIPDFSP